jgi:DNA-binding transcriptional ArsR family regulator
VLAVVRQFAQNLFSDREAELMARLRREAVARQGQLHEGDAEASIARITGGYAYEREPELDHVLLIPHFAAPPWLLLCQHDDARIICYPASAVAGDPEAELRERAVLLGRTLSDEKRIEILRRLAAGEASLNQLVDETGLVKSTVHHHLTQLRAARLITLRGNARAYRYSLSPEGFDAGRTVLQALLDLPID